MDLFRPVLRLGTCVERGKAVSWLYKALPGRDGGGGMDKVWTEARERSGKLYKPMADRCERGSEREYQTRMSRLLGEGARATWWKSHVPTGPIGLV